MVDARAWNAGNYREIAFGMLPIVARLVEETRIAPGARVLDVGCGSGTVSIVAAQRGARVTGLDLTPRMLDLAREDAALAGVDVEWQEGDAQKMPFPDASFDAVVSNMGHMFAPDAQAAADEMLRVLRPGGRLGFTCWARGHLMHAMHQAIEQVTGRRGTDVTRWGSREFVERTLGTRVRGLLLEHGTLERPALSLAHQWSFMSRAAPPLAQALAELPPEGQERLRAAYVAAAAPFHRPPIVRSEYVIVTATRA